MSKADRAEGKERVIAVLNEARSMELQAIHQYMNQHYNYFDNVDGHIKELGSTYLAKIAGTPGSTGLQPLGFAVRQEGGA